ncbi:portal protein [Basilea psittacipulmonis]|uniref:Phage head-tail connector protein n=1 Tax=Basilea psittacipulmonis DSM 24701 TaxID=1072685 RepID=A0A077DG10_9BURK|nr:portal protein [Basilea psittacipulmonis]AIL33101.1 phage head-tail connector protein [Basilea psittacipulmonis DSM 24701]
MVQSPRKLIEQRWQQLKNERASWDSHWQDIASHLLPRSGRFGKDRRNDGSKKHNLIHDSTGTRALRVLSAGLMAGMTSPARPWFRLTTSDATLDESANVKLWLSDVTRLMQMVFAKSNTYLALHSCYEQLGAFGTACTIALFDFDSVVHHYPLSIGEYALATDYRGKVNTLYREFDMTVAQVVSEFGLEACSTRVKNLYDRGSLDQWVTVVHAIEPRSDRNTSKKDNKNMPFKSIYFEQGQEDEYKYLRESGFEQFPALCPRWLKESGDVYGMSPAMEALGDIKQLQHEQMRKAQGIDYQTKPPLQAPTNFKNSGINLLPGGITFVDSASATGGVRTAFEAQINLSYLLDDIRDVRSRIEASFYADLFLMIANSDRRQMTATEVAERHEEKLLMLGPVLERLHNEILHPLIDITFARMVEADIVPPPPEELQGMNLNVEFVSMLAQAQRAVATNSIDRFVSNLGAIASMKPEVLDKLDADKWADMYSDMLGVDPELIVPSDKVALIREQRAQAQQQAQQMQAMQQGADMAKTLSSVKGEGQEGLSGVLSGLTGYT